MKTVTQLVNDLILFGGAIVSSDNCTELEIEVARKWDRFAADENGFGFVRHTKEWADLLNIAGGKRIRDSLSAQPNAGSAEE